MKNPASLNNQKYEAVKHIVSLAGGQSALARICNVQQPHVWAWLHKHRQIPAEHVAAIYKYFKRKNILLSLYDIRPDLYDPADQLITKN